MGRPRTRLRRAARRGLSLIEVAMVVGVLGLALPPLSGLYAEVAQASVDDIHQAEALALAESLMEEIVSKAYEDPDEDPGSFGTEEASRADYDDIDDYDGLSNSPPEAIDGTDLDEVGSMTRSVLVDNVLTSDTDPTSAEADGSSVMKRVRVTVSWTGGRGGSLTLATLRASLAEEEEEEAGSGGLDIEASEATAHIHNDSRFDIDLVNDSGGDLEIESYSLSADEDAPALKEIKLDNTKIVHNVDIDLPTGTQTPNTGSSSDATINDGDDPEMQLKFRDNFDDDEFTFTLTLNYVGGGSDTLTFTLDWDD